MSGKNSDERVAEAWSLVRKGQAAEAIKVFEGILSRSTNHLDANYGLGLANKVLGNKEAAITAFKRVLSLAEAGLEAVSTTAATDGHVGGNNLNTIEDDRYMMLVRMTQQRLEELKA